MGAVRWSDMRDANPVSFRSSALCTSHCFSASRIYQLVEDEMQHATRQLARFLTQRPSLSPKLASQNDCPSELPK